MTTIVCVRYNMYNIRTSDLQHRCQRRYTLLVLAQLASHSGVTEVSEEQVINWANQKVASSGKTFNHA